jgi:hypothetical protein
MLTVHGELHYVVAGHPWQLLRNNILEFYQISHALKCPIKENNEGNTNSLVIADNHKLKQTLLLFVLDTLITLHET